MKIHYANALRSKADEEGRLAAYEAVLTERRMNNPYSFFAIFDGPDQSKAWRDSFDECFNRHRRDKN